MEKVKDTIHIRYANRDEIFDIAVFLHDCWQAEYREIISEDFLDSMKVKDRHERLLNRFDEKTSELLIMYEGNKLIGVSVFGKSFTEGYENDGEISALYLRHEYIGKGYGHYLFIRIEEALAAKGYEYLVLDLLEGNDIALKFYIDHDYNKVADTQYRFGEIDYPLIVLRKRVNGEKLS